MGTKLYTVIFNPKLVTPEQISQKLLSRMKEITSQYFIENNEMIPDKLPSVRGSYFLEFTKPRSAEPYGRMFFDIEMLAKELSSLFQDIP